MKENDELLEALDIRETVDGKPVPEAGAADADGAALADALHPKSAARSAQAAFNKVKAVKPHLSGDPYIWGIYLLLLVISVLELYSASSSEVRGSNIYGPLIRHGIFLTLGFGIVLLLQRTHYVVIRRLAYVFAAISLALLILSSVMGVEINGAQRAIMVMGMTIQPAEIVKLSVVVLLATILSKSQTPGGVTNSGVITAALVVVFFGAALWKNGLTNMLLLMGVSMSMFLIGGIQWKKFGVVLIAYAFCGGLLYMVKYTTPEATEFDKVGTEQTLTASAGGETVKKTSSGGGRAETHRGRLQRYIDGVHPDDPMDDYNRQVIFANFAQAHGGLTGRGVGNSRESSRLPLAFSDYIYSIIVEDTGFIGGVCLLLLYLLLLARAGRLAYKCSRAFPAFLIMGCAVLIVFQALVHMAIVTGVFPVSGQPLPFISKGGTSILVMSLAIGMMLSVSRFAVTSGKAKDIRAEVKELPEDMLTANVAGYASDKK